MRIADIEYMNKIPSNKKSYGKTTNIYEKNGLHGG